MPYDLREENGKWCVYNKDTGENKGCSDTRDMAVQHMRALYAHEPGAKSGPLSLGMTITKAEKTSQGFIRWRGRCNTGEVDSQNEKFDGTFWLDLCHNFMRAQKALSMGQSPPDNLPVPILDVAHYSMTLGSDRMKARAGWPVRLWVDGKALMAEGFYDDSPIGKASAAAGMRPEGKRPRISICVYPDWGNVSVEDGTLTYKGGRDMAYLDHLAQTMYPVNAGTDIVAEVSMEKSTTIAQDAQEVLGDETLAKELEDARTKAKSAGVPVAEGAVIKADTPETTETPAPVDAGVAPEEPVDKAKREDVSEADKKRAEKEYGDVQYADEANKKYPIDTEEHIRAAWSYIGMPKNASKYPDGGAAIKQKIVAAWKKVISPDGPPKVEEKKSEAEAAPEATPAPAPVVAPETPDAAQLSSRLDALATAFGELSKALTPFMQEMSEKVKSLATDVEGLKQGETQKVKSAIDFGGDWLANFYNPRTAADNKVGAAEVKKSEPVPDQPVEQQQDGIWGAIRAIAQKPGG